MSIFKNINSHIIILIHQQKNQQTQRKCINFNFPNFFPCNLSLNSKRISFTIKTYKYIDQRQQKLQINQKSLMDTNNRSEYLSRIEEIRSKIQSKQSSVKQTRSKQYQQSQSENISKYDKIDHFNYINQLEKRKPLESVENKVTHFQERVTKLDSVSERIKNILSNKRPTQEHEPNNEKTKNQKITSLFQKEIHVAQSKVAEVSFNDIRVRQFGNFSKDKMSLPMTNVNTNINQKENKVKVSLEKIEKTPIKPSDSIANIIEKPSESLYDTYKAKSLKDAINESSKAKYSFPKPCNTSSKQANTQIQKDTAYSSIRDFYPYKKENTKENNYTGISYSATSAPSNIEKQVRNESKKELLNLRTTFQLDSFPQTKRLIEILSKQIELEVSLRGSKERFDAFRSQAKLNMLKQQLSKRKISFSQKQIDEWIKIDDEEFDPFVSIVFKKEFNFDELISNLIQAKNHWEQKVKKCVNLSQLKKQEFKLKEIELNKRGQIYLEDFVCFINLKNDSSLRNRDLYSLFKHFMLLQYSSTGNQHKIREETFLNYVAK